MTRYDESYIKSSSDEESSNIGFESSMPILMEYNAIKEKEMGLITIQLVSLLLESNDEKYREFKNIMLDKAITFIDKRLKESKDEPEFKKLKKLFSKIEGSSLKAEDLDEITKITDKLINAIKQDIKRTRDEYYKILSPY